MTPQQAARRGLGFAIATGFGIGFCISPPFFVWSFFLVPTVLMAYSALDCIVLRVTMIHVEAMSVLAAELRQGAKDIEDEINRKQW